MQLNSLDWIVVALALAAAFSPALFFARRAGRGTTEFFASGHAAPWWLIGTSMVATTFSTDTPNLVTDLVRNGGVSANWAWWAFLLTGMATVFFYSRLWRRLGSLTDLEFYELRYSGNSAAVVRGFRAIYLGLFFNCVIMGSVTLAAAKIANVMLGWDRLQTVIVCAVICIGFSVLSGLWGVLASDIVQFIIAMVGVFAATSVALNQPEVGGLQGLITRLEPSQLNLLPDFSNTEMVMVVLIIPLTVQWWSVWYPGAEPGGGSYVAQRMLAAKNEKHALAATLWFNVAHYALRPWPWILVALSSLLVFPQLSDIQRALPGLDPGLLGHDIAYPAMLTLLPHGLLGLLVASLLSAYVSTMSTHLNWGASYLVNDFYRRFFCPEGTEKHLVRVSRLVTALLMLAAGGVMFLIDTAGEGFQLLLSIGAGTGLLYLLRWFWWRINAWSEIAAMISSFLVALGFLIARKNGADIPDHISLVLSVFVTTAVWVVVTFLTPPTESRALVNFVQLVKPAGPGWTQWRHKAGVSASSDSLPQALWGWTLGCAAVYAAMFSAGNFLYGRITPAVACLAVFLVTGWLLARLLRGIWAGAD
jgi:SSS family solute:Na+ symporter